MPVYCWQNFQLLGFGAKDQIQLQFKSVVGDALLSNILAANRPVIVVMPHLGSRELLVQWIQINYPMFGLYKPSKLRKVDQLIYNARSQFGCQPFPAARGVMGLMRQLKRWGDGDFTGSGTAAKRWDFYRLFGQPAYTMTLLHRITRKWMPNYCLLLVLEIRISRAFQSNCKRQTLTQKQDSVEIFNQALNQQIESMIRQNPEQYVWDYKRYKRQPDNSDIYALDKN
ncbi:MAG: lysophospholipid acyltransferase family protein [Enterobacterales bacterium]|nr:lysophospholipid acyltransferase family protein [Enterobacterales bacterium]